MRSSIACARCRRSKVKCVNSGVHTTCKACESSGRECVYPVPGGSGAAIVASTTTTSSGGTDTPGRSGGGGLGNISHLGLAQQILATAGSGSGGDGSGGGGASSGGSIGGGGGGGGGGAGGGGPTAVPRHRPKKPSGASTGLHHSHGGMQSGVTSLAGGSKNEYAGSGASSGKVKGMGSSISGLGGSPFQGGVQVHIYGALLDGCGIPSADEVLGDVNMSWQFWHAMVGYYWEDYIPPPHLSNSSPLSS